MSEKASELELLLSEKKNADDRIGAYYQLQSTILGVVLSAVIGFLGFVFSGDGVSTGTDLTYVLLASVAVVSIAGLQSTIFNGFALGYVYYKSAVLGPRFQVLLSLESNPLSAAHDINASPARRPIMLSTRLLIIAQVMLGLLLFAGALSNALVGGEVAGRNALPLISVFVVAGTLLGGSFVAAFSFGKALDAVRGEAT